MLENKLILVRGKKKSKSFLNKKFTFNETKTWVKDQKAFYWINYHFGSRCIFYL